MIYIRRVLREKSWNQTWRVNQRIARRYWCYRPAGGIQSVLVFCENIDRELLILRNTRRIIFAASCWTTYITIVLIIIIINHHGEREREREMLIQCESVSANRNPVSRSCMSTADQSPSTEKDLNETTSSLLATKMEFVSVFVAVPLTPVGPYTRTGSAGSTGEHTVGARSYK